MAKVKFDTIKSLKELIKDLPDDMEVLTFDSEVDSEKGTPIYQFEIDEKENTLTIY